MSSRGRPPADDVLTPGEWRVVEAVRHGLTNPQIARRVGTSVDAVKYHVANALQKLGFARRAQLRHWDGVRRSSPLARRGVPMETTIALGTLGQVSRSVADLASAVAWYRDALGLRHLYSFGTLAFFELDGVRLFLSQGEAPATDSILYFRVRDIHGTCRALQQRGVEFIDAPHLIHRHADGSEEWMSFFKDPEGRPLALMEQVAP
jgi:DNA-binding CsgD family transcriptional regulator/catechol 2,3-dioxygenase-like lactoylglutathione lyase family enzyme